MQVLTIVENNHVTGVVYGMVEIGEKADNIAKRHALSQKYARTKNQIKNIVHRQNTTHK